jgi:hypothetical protein
MRRGRFDDLDAGAPGARVKPRDRSDAVASIAIFPANVHAARSGASLGGRPATPLALRLPMQLLFIGLAWWVTQPAP